MRPIKSLLRSGNNLYSHVTALTDCSERQRYVAVKHNIKRFDSEMMLYHVAYCFSKIKHITVT